MSLLALSAVGFASLGVRVGVQRAPSEVVSFEPIKRMLVIKVLHNMR